MSKFEITEAPTLENTSTIEMEGLIIGKQPDITGTTPILKVTVNGEPFYHFSLGLFDTELATKDSSIVIGEKRFYKGLKDRRMKNRLKLKSLVS